MAEITEQKNESELLFRELESYPQAHGIEKWDYEPEIEGKNQHPDCRVWVDAIPLFFEVKEFRQDPRAPLPQGGP